MNLKGKLQTHLASRSIRIILSIFLLLSALPAAVLGANEANKASDIKNHWAEGIVQEWQQKGWILGYEDGTVQPDHPVTRAEFVQLVNRSIAISSASNATQFVDLPNTDWAYPAFAQAVQAGYLEGYEDGTIRPHQRITRQELAVVLGKIAGLDQESTNDLPFTDSEQIADWSQASIAQLSAKRVFVGYADGSFQPANPVTRAEAIVALQRTAELLGHTFDAPGTYGPEQGAETYPTNVHIKSEGVTLRNVIIQGDLVIAESVGEGDVILEQVQVLGTVVVKGGGANSIHLKDSSIVNLIVDKKNGNVRIVAAGETSVEQVEVQSGVIIEESELKSSGFNKVTLKETLAANSKVTLLGTFTTMDVEALRITLEIPKGSIEKLVLGLQASNNQITIGKDAKVVEALLQTVVQILGEGKVEKAVLEEGAKGTKFQTPPISQTGSGAATAPVMGGPFAGPGPSGPGPSGPGSISPKNSRPAVTSIVYTNSSFIQGTAEPSSTVTIKLNDAVIATGQSNTEGKFDIAISGAQLTAGSKLYILAQTVGKTVSDSTEVLVEAAPKHQVSVIGAQTIKITFASQLADTSTVHAQVYMGDFNLPMMVKSIEFTSKQEMVIEVAASMLPGSYSASITGAGALITLPFQMEMEQLKLEFLLSSAVSTDGINAYTKYRISNQYNEDVTANYYDSFNWISNGKESTASRDGKIIFPEGNYAQGYLVAVTGYHLTKKVSASIILKVDTKEVPNTESPKPSEPTHPPVGTPGQPGASIEILKLYHKDNLELREDRDASEFKLIVSAKDSAGNKLDASAMNQNVIRVTSWNGVVKLGEFSTMLIDGQPATVLNLIGPLKNGTEIITLYYGPSFARIELNIAEVSKLDQLHVPHLTKVIAGQKTELPFTATDQFGSPITELTEPYYTPKLYPGIGSISVQTNSDGETKLVYDGSQIPPYITGSQYLFVVGSSPTGNLIQFTLTLVPDSSSSGIVELGKDPVVTELTFSDPVIAVFGEQFEIPFVAKDQYGHAVTDLNILRTVQLGITLGESIEFIRDQVKQQTKLVAKLPDYPLHEAQKAHVFAFLASGKSVQHKLTLLPKAKPEGLNMIFNFPQAMAEGASSTIKMDQIGIYDQYGRVVRIANKPNYKVVVSVNSDIVSLTSNEMDPHNLAVLTALKSGKTTVKFELLYVPDPWSSPLTIAMLSLELAVAGPKDIAGYSVADIPRLYATDDSRYAKRIQVTGYLDNGQRVIFNNGDFPDYYNVSVSDATYLRFDGLLSAVHFSDDNVQEKMLHISFEGHTSNGVITIIKDVAVSKESPQIHSMSLTGWGPVRKINDSMVSVNLYEFNPAYIQEIAEQSVRAVDQYGVGWIGNKFVHVEPIDLTPGRNLETLLPGDQYSLKCVTENGKVFTFKVIIR